METGIHACEGKITGIHVAPGFYEGRDDATIVQEIFDLHDERCSAMLHTEGTGIHIIPVKFPGDREFSFYNIQGLIAEIRRRLG
jgi:hypothetical protein